jgi:hypothetical protein
MMEHPAINAAAIKQPGIPSMKSGMRMQYCNSAQVADRNLRKVYKSFEE